MCTVGKAGCGAEAHCRAVCPYSIDATAVRRGRVTVAPRRHDFIMVVSRLGGVPASRSVSSRSCRACAAPVPRTDHGDGDGRFINGGDSEETLVVGIDTQANRGVGDGMRGGQGILFWGGGALGVELGGSWGEGQGTSGWGGYVSCSYMKVMEMESPGRRWIPDQEV
jgi:hypothetical protein